MSKSFPPNPVSLKDFTRAMQRLGWEQVPDGTHGHICMVWNGRTDARVKVTAPGRKGAKDQNLYDAVKKAAKIMGISTKEMLEKIREHA